MASPAQHLNYLNKCSVLKYRSIFRHLHHEPTCKFRHTSAVQIMSAIDEAKGLFFASQIDPTQESGFKKAAERILRAINFKSPFSGEMRFLLSGERDTDHPWIQGLLET